MKVSTKCPQLLIVFALISTLFIGSKKINAQVWSSEPFLIIDEDSTNYFSSSLLVDDIDWHFYRARTHALNSQDKLSAFEIRKAIAYIKLEAASYGLKETIDINKAVKKLENIAVRLDKVEAMTLYDLTNAFVDAHLALAAFHHTISTEYWKTEKPVKTGISLDAASKHLAYAATWSGRKIGEGEKESWRWARTITSTLLKGVGFVPEQVGRALNFIGTETKKLGDKVKKKPLDKDE